MRMGSGAEGTRSARCNAYVCIPPTEKPVFERFPFFKQRPSGCKIIDSAAIFVFHKRSTIRFSVR